MSRVLSLTVAAVLMLGGTILGQTAHYPFEGNADDVSGGANHGIVHGATLTTDRHGQPNSAYEFDGVDDFIEIPGGFLPLGSSARTFAAWVMTYDNTKPEQAIVQYGTIGLRKAVRFEIEYGQLALRSYSDDHLSQPLSADTWYHVAATYDGGTTLNFYVNGEYVETRYFGGALATELGHYQECIGGGGPDGAGSESFYGKIDDVHIFDRALSDEEVASLYAANGLIAWWPLDEESGDVVADASGQGFDGTATNTGVVAGVCGNARAFNGTDSDVNFESQPEYQLPTPFSFSLWVNFNGHDNYQYVIANAGGYKGFRALIWPGGGPYQFVFSVEGNGTTDRITSTSTLTPGEWYHIVCVAESDTELKIYIDGLLDAQGLVADIYDPNSSYPLKLGQSPINPFGWGAPYHLDGMIDNVMLFSYALDAEAVSELYEADEQCGDDVIHVHLDIKPGSCPNPLNVRQGHMHDVGSRGGSGMAAGGGIDPAVGDGKRGKKAVLPVAVLGTEDFEVPDIDAATVTLAGVPPVRWNYEDVSTPVADDAAECECNEDGPDGIVDLTAKFYRADIIDALGEVSDGDTVPLTISGLLVDGTPFEGVDCVIIRADGNTADESGPDTDVDNQAIAGINNFPNPFNPTTEIRFSLVQQADVKLEIFNIMGQRVSLLVDRRLDAGLHSLEWDGSAVASGVYFYRLTTSDFTATRKMILLK